MMMPGREYQAQPSRFGFNGKENDNDVKGFGNQQDYGMRIYDTRLGRFLSLDPLIKKFPELSPYQFASNRPIEGIDLNGLEYLSFHRSMYRMQHNSEISDSKMGNGSTQVSINSQTVVQIIYSNIPAALQDAKTQSFKYVSRGPVTTIGREYTADELSNVLYDKNRYFNSGPEFIGLANGGTSTNGINSLKGNTSMQRQVIAQNINGVGGTLGANGLGGILSNQFNKSEWRAIGTEVDLRTAFYNATNLADAYLSSSFPNGKNVLNDELKGSSDRADLINFLTDGFLPEVNILRGSEFSKLRRNQYQKQLTIAWHGLQMMQSNNIEIREETINNIKNILTNYKAAGGGNEYDRIDQYMKKPIK